MIVLEAEIAKTLGDGIEAGPFGLLPKRIVGIGAVYGLAQEFKRRVAAEIMIKFYSYNEYGQTTSITDTLGKVTTYQYDPASGFLSSIVYPKNSDSGSNPTYACARDNLGRIQSITDPLGRTTFYTYDNLGRIRTVTLPRPDPGFPDNFVLTYTYDNYEEVGGKKLVCIAQEDPNGRVSKYYYDEFNQLVRVVDAAEKVSQFVYNKGNLIQVQDANLNTTIYEYDKLRRLTIVHHPAGPTSSYTYYGDGPLKTKTDGKGQTIAYVYDKLKRLKEKQYPDGKKVIYAYSGEMMGSIQDQVANETTSFAYDQSYRLSSISNPRGQISYTYTAADQVQSYQVNSDPPVGLSYYDDGSVKNITRSGDSPLAYYYLLTGQKAQVLYPNNARIDYTYDDQGRLTSIINRKPDMSVLSSYTYGYDYNYATSSYTMKGYRTSMTNHLAQMEKYYFDNLYQLIRTDYANGDVYQWSYDDIGNRVQQVVIPSGQPPVVTNYTYYQNSQSRNSQLLQSDGLSTYTWDNNGNLLTKAATNYSWDYYDRLVGISGPTVSASYVYDYLGERIKKTVGGVETAYLYQAKDIIKESSGGTVANYVHGIGIDDSVVLDRVGAKSYYFSDGLGSIREITDATGTIQNSYTYRAWGELRASSATIPNSYGYTGREFAEDGLYFYRARYLDPGLGRFWSEDPNGFKVESHLYRYVYNNPIIFNDPFGTQGVPGGGWGAKVCCDEQGGYTICWNDKAVISPMEKKCMEEHEKSHIAYLESMDFDKYRDKGCPTQCNNKQAGFDQFTFPNWDKVYEFECLGYLVEMACLQESVATVWARLIAWTRIIFLVEHQKEEGFGCNEKWQTMMYGYK